MKGREGDEFGGGNAPMGGQGNGCQPRVPFQTNVRANASYTIPRIDVLASAVFHAPAGDGAQRQYWPVSNTDVVWEPGSAARATGGAPDPITGEPTPSCSSRPLETRRRPRW